MLNHSPLAVILVALFATVASVGAITPTSTGLALQGHARNAGTASALLGAAQYVVGAVIAPLVASRGASGAVMAVTMASAAVVAVISFSFIAKVKTQAATGTGLQPSDSSDNLS